MFTTRVPCILNRTIAPRAPARFGENPRRGSRHFLATTRGPTEKRNGNCDIFVHISTCASACTCYRCPFNSVSSTTQSRCSRRPRNDGYSVNPAAESSFFRAERKRRVRPYVSCIGNSPSRIRTRATGARTSEQPYGAPHVGFFWRNSGIVLVVHGDCLLSIVYNSSGRYMYIIRDIYTKKIVTPRERKEINLSKD